MKHTKILLFITILLFSVSACNVTSKVASNVTYKAPTLTADALENGGLALLPVVAGSGVEGYRRPFGEAINQTATNQLTNYLSWNDTLELFNNAGIVSDYNRAINSYRETGIIDREVLRMMHEATDMNYFLFIQLMPPTSDRNFRRSAWTGDITTEETKSVSAFGLIWSYVDGDVVWEGSATAAVTTGEMTYTRETDMERAAKVADALVRSLRN